MPSFSAKDLREALHDLDSLDPNTDFTTVANSEGLQATLSASIYPITRCDCKIGKLNNGGQGRVTRATAAARMHPRNVFADTSTDFFVLGKRQPCFRPFVEQSSVSRWHVNFKSWEVTRALNRALLIDGYGLVSWDIPKGHLCPPVANRANYIHWLEDLLQLSRPSGGPNIEYEGVRGIDIGIGSNCVFPLLGAATNRWSFVGIDVTDVALKWADKNRLDNPILATQIQVRDARNSASIRDQNTSTLFCTHAREQFTFCMCNPPFFETMKHTKQNPGTNFGGTHTEMCCSGGEEAFTRRIYDDSLMSRDRVYWYTTMCGKKETMRKLRRLLDMAKVPAIRTAQFLQGKTVRWGVAWSFSPQARQTSIVPLRLGTEIKFNVPTHIKPCWRVTLEQHANESSRLPEEVTEEVFLVLEKCGCGIMTDFSSYDTFKYMCVMGGCSLRINGSNQFWVKILKPSPGADVVVTAACDDKSAACPRMQHRFTLTWEATKARMTRRKNIKN